MDAKDLMIGDLVQVPSELNRYKIIRSTFDMDSAVLYEPIPLTTEILKKNFSSTPEWYFVGTNKYCLRISKYKTIWDFYFKHGSDEVTLKLTYVHQLQHALKLCGINKEIEL